jgi:hypothetical protein
MRANAPETGEGDAVWRLVLTCERQLRMGMNGPYALDVAALLMVAAALDVDPTLLLEILPTVETAILFAWSKSE